MSYPSPIRMGDCNLSVASSCTAEFQSICFDSILNFWSLLSLILILSFSMLISGFDEPADDAEQKSRELVVYWGG
jgi:hypothetical protein